MEIVAPYKKERRLIKISSTAAGTCFLGLQCGKHIVHSNSKPRL
jgi:hypothetical protein